MAIPEKPISRIEHYLARANGQNVQPPEPISRIEHYLNGIAGGVPQELLDDVADLKSELNNTNEEVVRVESAVLPYVRQYTDWTNGTYESSGYQPLPSSTVSNKYSRKLPAGEYIITPSDNIRWEAYYYNSDASGTQIYSMSSSARKFTATGEFVITIGKTGGGSLDGLENNIIAFRIDSKNDALINAQKIQLASNDFEVNRYNNIYYYDRMVYSTLSVGTALEVGIDDKYVWQGRPYSIYFKTDPTRTSSECRINYPAAFKLLGTQEFDIAVYIPDVTKVTGIRVSVPSSDFVKSAPKMGQTLVNGWNFIRLMSEGAGNWTDNTDNTQIRVLANHISGAEETVYIGYLMQVSPRYGNLIIIADGPYYTFYTLAYPELKEIGVPVVWALDPALLDTPSTTPRKLINEAELESLAYDGISEFSFHNYDGTIMSDASAELALEDTLKSIRYLKQHGLEPERIFRAAWLQNSCAHPELANLELDASASYTGASGVTAYPFPDRYNIPRIGLANRTESYIDNLFEKLRKQHCTILAYFHGVSTESDKEVTPTMLTYILNAIQTAITEGYLNPTTYNRLVSYYSKS